MRVGETTTCLTLLLLGFVLIQVPSSTALALGGTGLACAAGAASPTASPASVTTPSALVMCLILSMVKKPPDGWQRMPNGVWESGRLSPRAGRTHTTGAARTLRDT